MQHFSNYFVLKFVIISKVPGGGGEERKNSPCPYFLRLCINFFSFSIQFLFIVVGLGLLGQFICYEIYCKNVRTFECMLMKVIYARLYRHVVYLVVRTVRASAS